MKFSDDNEDNKYSYCIECPAGKYNEFRTTSIKKVIKKYVYHEENGVWI